MNEQKKKIPSYLWMLIFLGGMVLLVVAIWGFAFGAGYIEGFSSIALLVIAWIFLRIGNKLLPNIGLGETLVLSIVGIIFFAAMGASLDQPGNFIYNKALKWAYCPENTELLRETLTRRGSRGGVEIYQNFTCVAQNGQVLRQIGLLDFAIVRFAEYLLIGCGLFGLSRFYSWLKLKIKK